MGRGRFTIRGNLKTYVPFLVVLSMVLDVTAQEELLISGKITEGSEPLSDVTVTLSDPNGQVLSDDKGFYTVRANPKSTLSFDRMGLQSQHIILEDISRTLNITMDPEIEQLDEVQVETEANRTQAQIRRAYDGNDDLIGSFFGVLDKKRAGHAMHIIDSSDLLMAGVDFMTVLQTRVPGARVVRPPYDPFNPQVYLRGGSALRGRAPVLFEIDGAIYARPPMFIPVETIDRIAVLPSLVSTMKYGSQARGGVIVINTKGNASGLHAPGYHQGMGSNDPMSGVGRVQDLDQTSKPEYLIRLNNATTRQKALETFDAEKAVWGSSAFFLLDAADYFASRWQDTRKAKEILDRVSLHFTKNPEILKALAYTYEKWGFEQQAVDVYMELLRQRPAYAQSYRDLAHGLINADDVRKGLKIYARYIRYTELNERPLLEEDIDSTIMTEFTQTLNRYSGKLNLEAPKDRTLEGTRIILEWNNGEAEFDLQFVSPENRAYVWSHTRERNPGTIAHEKRIGYASRQFLIDGNNTGEWMLNVKYLGNKSYDPTYMKATVYHDYGTQRQRSKTHYFKLTDKNVNFRLLSLVNSG